MREQVPPWGTHGVLMGYSQRTPIGYCSTRVLAKDPAMREQVPPRTPTYASTPLPAREYSHAHSLARLARQIRELHGFEIIMSYVKI